MPQVLRFGISSLDELLGAPPEKPGSDLPLGIFLPGPADEVLDKKPDDSQNEKDTNVFTTSVCLIGPTGTGKSIFALHMASTYLSDCKTEKGLKKDIELPTILYISTDLTYKMALRAWNNFALNYPLNRRDPFSPKSSVTEDPIELVKCHPTGLAENFKLVSEKNGHVLFLDMAAYTAGDDWGFLHKLLSLLSMPNDTTQSPRHLVVIDAIEGFEALAGDINAFGEKSTRRSRIAQVMRLIAGKCHLLTVVEQSKGIHSEETLGEEFVADTVIRLDSISTRNYERRMLKVEKCRGQSHIRGQHHYSIRSGIGSTTGEQTNPDDPMVPALDLSTITKKPDAAPDSQNSQAAIKPTGKNPAVEARSKKNDDTNSTDEKSDAASTSKEKENATQSYVQVFHSVHRISRKIMEDRPDQLEIRPPKPDPKTPPPPARYAAFGIEHLDNMLGGKTEVTDSKTYNDFQYDTRGLPCSTTTALIGDSLTQKTILGRAFLSRCFFKFHERMFEMRNMLDRATTDKEAVNKIWSYITRKVDLISTPASQATRQNESYLKDLLCRKSFAELIGELEKSAGKNSIFPLKGDEKTPLLITNLARWLLGYPGGVAVMLVTHNTDSDLLAAEFTRWLHSEDELTRLNQRMEGYRDALKTYIKGGTICRRLEIHSLSSEVLVHIVKQAIHAAQRKIMTHQEMEKRHVRYPMSWPVRLVIDDFSSLRSIFPELREDPLLFPSMLFHLEREGVTTLIVDTQSGKPETTIVERFETELRQMVHHRLYTWRVPFYGESRVAITAIPPLSHEYAGIVREVRWETGQMDGVQGEPATVDPHFELYSGLEEGNPQPVPLHARFYAETPAMQEYIEIENHFLGELFNCHSRFAEKNPPRIIFGMLSPGYSDLRSLAYLQRDTRLDYTFIFQVDEFWAMRPPGRHKRAGAFQPQWSYLDAITATSRKTNLIDSGSTPPEPRKPEDYKPNVDADPYELFMLRKQDATPKKRTGQESDVLRRRHFYEHYYQDFEGYEIFEDGTKEQYHLDRVPFSWDFGFLLCQEKAWKDNVRTFVVERADQTKVEWKVREVWQSLIKAEYDETARPARARDENSAKNEPPIKYVSWRIFAEACKKAAEEQSEKLAKPASAFDFAQISPESFSSLMLEVWLSDIYDSLTRDITQAPDDKTKADLEAERMRLLTVTKRQLFIPIAEPLKKPEPRKTQGVTPSSESQKKPERITLLYLVEKYWLELYKSWLLLIELINLHDIIGEAPVSTFELKSKNTDFCAISSRHWYKTATQCPDDIATQEPLVAVRLPGHFSVRGDWFLAVSGGSRSIRQAERALDLLNSRRANITRLQMGVGLPTRIPKLSEPGDKPGPRTLFTKLISHQHGQHSVEYDTLLKIAADSDSEFYWAWRSSLEDYAESNRIWHRWLNCALLWWHRKLLRYRSAWRNSFEIHDALNMRRLEPDEFTDRKGLRAKEEELDKIESPTEKQAALKTYVEGFSGAKSIAQLNVRAEYLDLWNLLIEELQRVPIVQTETAEDR